MSCRFACLSGSAFCDLSAATTAAASSHWRRVGKNTIAGNRSNRWSVLISFGGEISECRGSIGVIILRSIAGVRTGSRSDRVFNDSRDLTADDADGADKNKKQLDLVL